MSPSVQWMTQFDVRFQLYFFMPLTVALSLPAKVTLFSMMQFSNADLPMLVTLDGIVTDVRPLQPPNAYSPMLVTLVPISTV